MSTLWFSQYLLAAQVSVELLSRIYTEWSKGIARLAAASRPPLESSEHFDETWLDNVNPFFGPDRHHAHVVNCAASVYCRDGFNLARSASNDPNWRRRLHEV